MKLDWRDRVISWLTPTFWIALVGVFVLVPWSFKDKLDAVCFGI